MNKWQYQYLLIISLIILLGVLAFFQYKWVGQISEAEQERLQKRLDIDARHFAEDFNRIIQNAYFTFQINGNDWQNSFLERFELWQQKSQYPQLIQSFEIVLPTDEVVYFDKSKKSFLKKGEYQSFSQFQSYFEAIDEDQLILKMPIYEPSAQLPVPPPIASSIIQTPVVAAFLVIKLDEETIKNQILPDLNKKHFPDDDFKLLVKSRRTNELLFQTEPTERVDVSVGIFELMPENLAFFVNRNLMTTLTQTRTNRQIIINRQFENKESIKKDSVNLQFQNESPMKFRVMNEDFNIGQSRFAAETGRWILGIQHKDGSLEEFVGKTRRRNLFLSFGILGLLGGSVGLILISARRAQVLAQRQLEFVSAVSHEFRTPIAVIYSAAENLADGIAREGQQVSLYGDLIKGEGKKLSAMVEQILEFAGARSGQKKYDLKETNAADIIQNALDDCQHLITEKDFVVETEIEENLPKINADFNAISHAIQNLVINGIKYSNGNNWLRILARKKMGSIQISVEDKGIGISKKDLQQIFSPFYRAKEVVDAQIHGNGLGLSLVKQTIEAHQGKIKVESEIGKGSKFIIDLPFNEH